MARPQLQASSLSRSRETLRSWTAPRCPWSRRQLVFPGTLDDPGEIRRVTHLGKMEKKTCAWRKSRSQEPGKPCFLSTRTWGSNHEIVINLFVMDTLVQNWHLIRFFAADALTCINSTSKQKYKDANTGNELMWVLCPAVRGHFRGELSYNKEVLIKLNVGAHKMIFFPSML